MENRRWRKTGRGTFTARPPSSVLHPASALLILLLCVSVSPCLAADPQTGTPRRLIAADYQKKIIAIVNGKNEVEWQEKIRDIHDVAVLPNGNILFQPDWTTILEMSADQNVVWKYDAAKMNGNAGKKVEIHAFQRLADGVTMIAESGPGRIIEVDRDGKLLKQIQLKVAKPDPHRDTRLVRKLENGHYLVAHEGDGVVREYDDAGKVVWEYTVGAAVYSAIRLPSGNTLIGGGNGSKVLEVSPAGEIVWKIEKSDLPGITLAWVTMVSRLSNGNTLIVNCHAGADNPQIIEVTPDKKVVWTFKDFDRFGNALPAAQVLDDPKALR
jgi:outer membrane protein assembly factor BamB